MFTRLYVRWLEPAPRALLVEGLRRALAGCAADLHVEPDRWAPDVLWLVPAGTRRPSSREAWDLALALREALPVEAEPQFVVRVPGEPPPRPAREGLARGRSGDDEGGPHWKKAEWSLRLVRAREAWARVPGRGRGIVIGHPDTGYTRHPELFGDRLLHGRGHDFHDGDRDPLDPLDGPFPGHGTRTASVIVSAEGAQGGWRSRSWVSGTAPEAALVPLRASDSVVNFDQAALADAIRYAAFLPEVDVISISMGGPPSQVLELAVRTAVNRGILVLAAAGNVWPWVVWPAAYEDVVAVAACTIRRTAWESSASGPAVAVTAPGEDVWVASPREDGRDVFNVVRGSGTSYAVATTAGVAALWLAHHGRDELRRRYPGRLLARAFKRVLAACPFPPVHGVSDRGAWGSGILDAVALLEQPLPDPAALHLESVAPGEALSLAAALQALFPAHDAAALRRAAGAALGDPARLERSLGRHGPELLFHLSSSARDHAAFAALTALRPAAAPAAAREAFAADPLAGAGPGLRGLRERAAEGARPASFLATHPVPRDARAGATMDERWGRLDQVAERALDPQLVGHRLGAVELYPTNLDTARRVPDYRPVVELLREGFDTYGLDALELDLHLLRGLSPPHVAVVHDPPRPARDLPPEAMRYALANGFEALFEAWLRGGYPARGKRLCLELKPGAERLESAEALAAAPVEGGRPLLEAIVRAMDDVIARVGADPAAVKPLVSFVSFGLDALEAMLDVAGPAHPYHLIATTNRWLLGGLVSLFSDLSPLREPVLRRLRHSTPWLTGVWFDPRFVRDCVRTFLEVDDARRGKAPPLQYHVSTYYSSFEQVLAALRPAGERRLRVHGLIFDLA